jgi:hypothetical protein
MIHRAYFFGLLVLALFATPGAGHAQVEPDSVRRENNCRLAARVIRTGHPAPRREWAWSYVGVCSPELKADIYMGAVREARHSNDLETIQRAIPRLVFFRDGRLFEEVLSIAGDPGAAVEARVVAFVALARILNPLRVPSYEGFVGGLDEHGIPRGGCGGRTFHAVHHREGPTPMPSDVLERIDELRNRVAADEAAPPDVRSAAACT